MLEWEDSESMVGNTEAGNHPLLPCASGLMEMWEATEKGAQPRLGEHHKEVSISWGDQGK